MVMALVLKLITQSRTIFPMYALILTCRARSLCRIYKAQQALIDMQFSIGDKKFQARYMDDGVIKNGWPNLFKAIQNEDWERAARESHRRDVSETRNKEIQRLLLAAAGTGTSGGTIAKPPTPAVSQVNIYSYND